MKYLYTWFFFGDVDSVWVASLTKCSFFGLVESGPKEATNSIKSSLLWDVFVLQKIEVCVTYYWTVGVFSLIELDVIVIVINRRLWLKTFCLYCYFSVFGGITDKCDDLWLLAVWLFYCFCIRPNDHAGGFCMSPILLYRENWVRIVLFVSKPVDVVGFELIRWNLFARFT